MFGPRGHDNNITTSSILLSIAPSSEIFRFQFLSVFDNILLYYYNIYVYRLIERIHKYVSEITRIGIVVLMFQPIVLYIIFILCMFIYDIRFVDICLFFIIYIILYFISFSIGRSFVVRDSIDLMYTGR